MGYRANFGALPLARECDSMRLARPIPAIPGCCSAPRFDRFNSIKCRNINCKDEQVTLNVLAVAFNEMRSPGGAVTLIFLGDADFRIEIECLECEMVDLGPEWAAASCPQYADDVDDLRTA